MALIAMLDLYKDDYPHPQDWKAFSQSFLKAAGLRSWRTLQLGSRCCMIERTATLLQIVPTRNGGTTGDDKGFHALADSTIELPSTSDPARLGAALLFAFDRCQ
jgi:hypothetical protein